MKSVVVVRRLGRVLPWFASLGFAAPAVGQGLGSEPPPSVAGRARPFRCPGFAASLTGPLSTVRYLADDALEGRFSGTRGAQCAGDYIAERFRALGLEPAGEEGYFQPLPLAPHVSPPLAPRNA